METSAVLSVIDNMRVGEPHDFGFYLILRRQIDTIQDIKTQIHPPMTERG